MPLVAPSNDALFAEILRRLVPAVRPLKVIAFGSRARGDARPDSDVDLLVVEPGGGTLGQRGLRVRGAIGDIGVPVDLVIYTAEEYERLRCWRSSVAAIADREGVVLHDALRAA
jgi:predicted nucleotidyltransferase